MNAVFERDYVAVSSSARFLRLRAGFALAMGVLLFFAVLPGYASADYSNVGSGVLSTAVGVGSALVVFAAPAAFATVIVHARAANTLPLLLATPLTATQVAWGSFVARASLLLLFVFATWPPIALALLFGGVRGVQLFEASAATVGTLLLVAAPSFVISAYARRTASAVVGAYLGGASVVAGLYLAGDAVDRVTSDPWYAGSFSPWHTISVALAPVPPAAGGPSDLLPAPYVLVLWTAALAALAITLTAFRLRQEGLGDGDPGPAARGRAGGCRPLRYENPLLDHELRAGALTRRRSAGRSLLSVLLLSEVVFLVAAHLAGEPERIEWHVWLLGFQFFVLVIAVAAAGATALALEHETGTLALLRVTPLLPREIVFGKLLGLARALFPCLLVPALHLAYAAWLGVFSPLAVPLVVVAGTVVCSAWAIFAMSQSLDQRDPRRAVVRTMGAFAIISFLLAGNLGLPLMAITGHASDEWIGGPAAFGANPAATMLLAATVARVGGSSVQTAVVPGPSGASLTTGATALLLWCGIHAAAGYAVYTRLFRIYRMRLEG